MLELMVVVSIVFVLTAIAVYNVQPAIRAVRLHGVASDYGDLLQNARIRAVKDDKYYTVLTNPSASPPIAFIDINGNGAYDLGEIALRELTY